jgi:hypothetical protein
LRGGAAEIGESACEARLLGRWGGERVEACALSSSRTECVEPSPAGASAGAKGVEAAGGGGGSAKSVKSAGWPVPRRLGLLRRSERVKRAASRGPLLGRSVEGVERAEPAGVPSMRTGWRRGYSLAHAQQIQILRRRLDLRVVKLEK